ncbi:MAG: YidC/Oxa1 family membrane protein insertase [Syntrophomonadaceae bacterium]
MWQSFVQWFAQVIDYLYGVTVSMGVPNYGLAIIFMTILIKLVMFPLTQKQMKSIRGMQEIQPKLKRIQERYKNDTQTMNQKVMEVYKEHGVNPFGGCLPLLIQMPIFIAFYQSLYRFDFKVEAHAAFLWIPNIGAADPYYILAILAGLTTYLQQKISMVNIADTTQRTMLYMMPLLMAWIAATMPAGLPLYWIVFNILGIFQQLYVNKSSAAQTASGIAVQPQPEIINQKADGPVEDEGSTFEQATRRGKGGKKKDGNPHNRKERKKRR